MSSLRLATRTSDLALAQARTVAEMLAAAGVHCELVGVTTDGDDRFDVPIDQLGGTGAFTGRVQRAVLNGAADVAVHSAKDLPSLTPPGLVIAAVPAREDAADVLVGRALAGLGPGARVATGSPRRRALLLERRPDLDVVGLRGNVPTRIAAVGQNGVDAVVVAAAALARLSLTTAAAERLDPAWFVPQVGQGALALEARVGDTATVAALVPLTHRQTATALASERAFLAELGAGCTVPVAAYATVSGATVTLSALMAAPDGSVVLRATRAGSDPGQLGVALARHLRDERGGAGPWGVSA